MPSSLKNDFNARLSVSETKIVGIETDLNEHKDLLKYISVKIDAVKERFDKMNGAIPHITRTLSNIEKHLNSVADTNYGQETKIEKNSLYIKLLWGSCVPSVQINTYRFQEIEEK